MKKILMVIGTRPEAIKMAPVIREIELHPKDFELHICVTGQHRSMLDQVLFFFQINPHTDLDLMEPNQSLASLTAKLMTGLSNIVKEFAPDIVMVHGDTTTAMVASLAAFYEQKKIMHIEAGLRTHTIESPFPEEANRQIISRLASWHMTPTSLAQLALLKEGVKPEMIRVTGNTVIDSLNLGLKIIEDSGSLKLLQFKKQISSGRVILVTSHRRENQGQGIIEICQALKAIALQNPDIQIVFPVHLNPKIIDTVKDQLKGIRNILLIEPLDYERFLWLMQHSYLIITDSGGIQEEAPSLNKPVLVMREETERQEAVDCGAVILVANKKERIVNETQRLLDDDELYQRMAGATNPYGNGTAARQIIDSLKKIV
ncbi:non-hydrolyzing UDP-N-acetylglucosamine 2-epimerase [Nonlabens antarcticus]|uniref:non-hydrolyzing UDP-N-acetylglucosamine 2-epimerase n=1 Tax=Nonlabens antarcticus TaxID=392714 RepID=UPI001891987A|nr:UDP-N-acetylglucosamine 2-epimerase (non-hydrolyzing) [Nonlabens antarcticus]